MTSKNIYEPIMCSCIICKVEKSVKGIYTHYIINHTIEGKKRYQERTKDFSQRGIEGNRKKNKQKLEAEKTLYELSKNYCLECKLELPFEKRSNKFCNNACSANHSNRKRHESGWRPSDDQKHKTSNTLKTNGKAYIHPKRSSVEFCICENCSKNFVKRYGKGSSKYCSIECSHEARSRKARNNKGLGTKRSKQEMKLFDLCKSYFGNVESNPILVDGWDCDIFLKDYNVAILWNGPWHYREMNFGNHSLSQVRNRDRIKLKLFKNSGYQTIVFEDRHFTPESAFEYLLNGMTGGV